MRIPSLANILHRGVYMNEIEFYEDILDKLVEHHIAYTKKLISKQTYFYFLSCLVNSYSKYKDMKHIGIV